MTRKKSCTQCGTCLNTCPVFALCRREEASPKAKQELLGEAGKECGASLEAIMRLANLCACCERCRSVCPRKLSVPEVLNEARAQHPVWQQRAWQRWIEGRAFLWPLAKTFLPLFPVSLLPAKIAALQGPARAMAEPAGRRPWLVLEHDAGEVLDERPVVLFGGCTATRLRPSWMAKARRTLERLGGRVLPSRGFGCCGGTFAHAGLPDAARRAAQANILAWRRLGKPLVVTICASCLHGLGSYAGQADLFADEEEARQWTAGLTPLSALLAGAKVTVTEDCPAAPRYHSPCHWGTKDRDLAWLKAAIPGLAKGTALCCGFGGILQLLDADLSRRLADRCWEGFSGAAAEGEGEAVDVVTGCSGCTLQLQATAPAGARAGHWLDIWQA